jgi:hypothetical protein
MPNWCNNEMTITHADPQMVQRAADAWNRTEFLQEFIPEPKEFPTKENGGQMPDWWHWRTTNWGVKWDLGAGEYNGDAEVRNGSFSVGFESPWSPPVEAYKKLLEMGFKIEAYYFEGGIGFCGSFLHGWDREYSLEGMTPKQIRKRIPAKLNKMFGIADWYEEMLSEQ